MNNHAIKAWDPKNIVVTREDSHTLCRCRSAGNSTWVSYAPPAMPNCPRHDINACIVITATS
eukprot:2025463-Pyramimonas_sp.AAC.1